MPLYEYGCVTCGVFADAYPMARAALPAPCPSCGDQAPRLLSATAIGRGGKRRGRGYRDPKLVKSTREPAAPRQSAVAAGHRPWMLGH